ncbi:hypothetical protein STEG23_034811, partial [Scotinomys teguina]
MTSCTVGKFFFNEFVEYVFCAFELEFFSFFYPYYLKSIPSLLVNVHCYESLVWSEASGFCYTIDSKWKELENIILGEVTQTQKDKHGIAELAKPLYEVTQEGQDFIWMEEKQQAFDVLKKKVLEAPELGLPDITKPFYLSVDEHKGIAKRVNHPDNRTMERASGLLIEEIRSSSGRMASRLVTTLLVIWQLMETDAVNPQPNTGTSLGNPAEEREERLYKPEE